MSQPTTPFAKRRAQERMRADIERFLETGGRVRQFDPTCREVKEPAIANRVQRKRWVSGVSV